MERDEHEGGPVGLAVTLVNELTPGWSRGSEHASPSAEERPGVLARALRSRPNRARSWHAAGAEEYVAAAALADRLRHVFTAAGDDDVAAAVERVNRLLAHGDVRPVLSDHDGEPWHLHAHWPDASPAVALRATCALGLAQLLADGHGDRLGTCAATSCDRVFHDTSRNASRRYCSTACQGRTKAAAYRARRTS